MFQIPAGSDKSGTDRILPMAPEFAIWLAENTPEADREGFVFTPLPQRGEKRMLMQSVSVVISKIGKSADIEVNAKSGSFASAHDLRRSFGQRWYPKLMPAQLMELMRHQSINTTMKFYAQAEAEKTADVLWEGFD